MKLELSIMKNEMTGEYTIKIINQTLRGGEADFRYKDGAFLSRVYPRIYENEEASSWRGNPSRVFCMKGSCRSLDNRELTTKDTNYIEWLKEAVEAYNKEDDKVDEALEKVKINLKNAVEKIISNLQECLKTLALVKTPDDYMLSKKIILKQMIDFPMGFSTCYYCVKHNVGQDAFGSCGEEACSKCEYKETHGGYCSNSSSDYCKTQRAITELFKRIDKM
jgi:hypothetical protein